MATLEQQRIDEERAERQRIANAALQDGTTFSGTGNMFPNLMNMFSFNQAAPTQTRQVVLDQMARQMAQPPVANQDGGFFNVPYLLGIDNRPGAGPITNPVNPNTMQNAIGSVYNLETGGMAQPEGVFTGDVPITNQASAIDNMTGEDVMGMLSGLQGLLGEPQLPMTPPKIASASPGLRLDINPYESLFAQRLDR